MLPQTGLEAAEVVAEKIRALIGSAPFSIGAADITVTASFGPQGPDLVLKVDGLLKAADQCLYRAKQEGRDRTVAVEIPCELAPAVTG